MKSFLRRVQGPWRSETIHQEITDELKFHIDMRVEENIRRGMSPDEARQDAERSFGNQTRIKEQGYDVRDGRWLETLWQDLRYGLRMMLKNPSFTDLEGDAGDEPAFPVLWAVPEGKAEAPWGKIVELD